MGKQRIAQLLGQLEANQQQDLKNAAEIYAVAQVAINQLVEPDFEAVTNALMPVAIAPSLSKNQLVQRYGSYNGCRKAAKDLGLQFRRTPSWTQLTQAFGCVEGLQQLAQSYLSTYSCTDLQGVTVRLRLDGLGETSN